MSLVLLAVSVGLVGNLATNLIEVDRPWWRPVVFGALGLLVIAVLVLETLWHRAERIREQLDPAREQARVFGAIPRPAWRWQPRPVEEKRVREAMGRRGRAALVALPGARGAGKSQLAAGYARSCLDHGFELVAWINAEAGPIPELALLAAHLDLPGAAEADPEQAAAAVCRWLQRDGKARRLVVFDNVDDPDTLRPYLPATGTTKVLITTNRQEFTAMAGITPVEVGMFTPAQGEQFLSRATGRPAGADSARLGMELGWLPLGLAQAAAFIARTGVSYAEYLRLLAGQNVDEALRRHAGSDHPGVLQSVALSLDGLAAMDPSGDAARLLRVFSLLSPDGISRDLLVQAEQRLGLTGGLWPVVDVLVEASLVTISGDLPATGLADDRRIVVHRLTALVIRYQASQPPGDDLRAALETTANLLDELTDRFPEDQVAWRRDELDELVAHLDAIMTHASEPLPLLLTQANWIARLLQQSGDLVRAIPLHEQTLTDYERVFGEDHPDTLASRNNLANASMRRDASTRPSPCTNRSSPTGSGFSVTTTRTP
ncbi:tetratricopeptide repeat protein [Actinoplanes ianthinogenes]|uniref:tetratricopeptide repeat protein n=1 Tax=Actinoplanes ianthinogenes TaxID=122358 RepID=UPI001E3DD90F|nr:tetratricopeptide repeat protein [Actinoplanes ianthinogenes]